MKSIQNIEVEIIEEFSMFDSWIDKYDYLIDLGKSLEILKDEFKTNSNNCISGIW